MRYSFGWREEGIGRCRAAVVSHRSPARKHRPLALSVALAATATQQQDVSLRRSDSSSQAHEDQQLPRSRARDHSPVLPNVSDVRLAVQQLHLRSGCFDRLDRYHEALVDCRRASLLDPTHADVYARRGYICNKLGWHHQAIDAFTSALNCGVPEESFLNNRYDPGSG